MDTPAAKPIRMLRAPQVRERTGLNKTHIQKLEAAGRFPKRIKLGEYAVGWIESEIDQWIADRIAASRAQRTAAA